MKTFTNKQEYLTARQEWKTEYAHLSYAIRATKLAIKKMMQEGRYAGSLQVQRLSQIAQANEMLKALAEAKVEAQKQYLVSKTECEA